MIDDDDPGTEEVERRREVRGIFRGLSVGVDSERYDALEASRNGFFVRCDEPDRFILGQVHEAQVFRGEDSLRCRVEVIRKEIRPRRGVALRIAFVDPAAEAALKKMLGIDEG